MHRIKKILAAFLCAAMLCNVQTVVPAAQTGNSKETTGWTEAGKETAGQTGTENGVAEQTADEDGKEESLLAYVVVAKPYIQTPDTQTIIAGLTDQVKNPHEAVLTLKNQTTGETMQIQASELSNDAAVFYSDFPEDSTTGQYILESMLVLYDGEDGKTSETIMFETEGIEAGFGVDQEVVTEPDAVVEEGTEEESDIDLDASVVTFDENGKVVSETSLESAIDSAVSALPQAQADNALDAVGSNKTVIVLDPGHDSTHGGTTAGGLREETLSLKIAQYCRAELQTYSNVEIYLTRETMSCPHPGTTSTQDNAARVAYAASVGAQIYVALHLNSSSSSSARGAEVYYPNSNGNAAVGSEGKKLAQLIENELVAIGLYNRGINIRNSESGDSFPDGTLMDYYGVIRSAKNYGIPAIIVEHAFQSSPSDVEGYLNSESGLKKLGVADATGIAKYFGLVKGPDTPDTVEIKSVKANAAKLNITWTPTEGATKYQIFRSTEENGTYTKIAVRSAAKTASYNDTVPETNTKYYYKIRSVTLVDGKKQFSQFGTPHYGYTLAVPQIRKTRGVADGQLLVKWTKVAGASGYYVFRSTQADGSYSKIATLTSQKMNTYTDTTVNNATDYYYKIRAYNIVDQVTGKSQASAAASGAAVAKTQINYAASSGSNSIVVGWDAVEGADSYRVKRASSENGSYKTVAWTGSGVTSYTDTSVAPGETWYYKINVRNKVNDVYGVSGDCDAAAATVLAKPEWTTIEICEGGIRLEWSEVTGAKTYQVQRSTSKLGGFTTIQKVKTNSCIDSSAEAGVVYYYRIRASVTGSVKNSYSAFSSIEEATAGYVIMGKSAVTAKQMAQHFKSKNVSYPKKVYKDKGASTVLQFCKIILEEAKAEGVRAEVVYAQICHETGYLQFGGDVNASQCNFAGLGATGNGAAGGTFPDVRTGIRAQVQHLKAYASKDALKQECVDDRFSRVKRNSAPYVEWLAILNNPNTILDAEGNVVSGCGWAANPKYGEMLLSIIKEVKEYESIS